MEELEEWLIASNLDRDKEGLPVLYKKGQEKEMKSLSDVDSRFTRERRTA